MAVQQLTPERRVLLAALMAEAYATRGSRYQKAMLRIIDAMQNAGYRIVPPAASIDEKAPGA